MQAPPLNQRTCFGPFTLDLRSGELYKHGVRLKLQDQPFQVLALLTAHPGEVVTRDEFRQQLWSADTFVDFDTGLNTAVKKLRDTLGDSADQPRYIQTLPRRGYRFVAALETASQSASLGQRDSATQLTPALQAAPPLPSAPSRNAIYLFFPRHTWLWAVIGAVLLLSVTAAYWRFRVGVASTARPKINSLAVLPLKNLSGDPAQDYLADGLTEELIGRLSGIRSLRVISRTSVMRYKDAPPSAPEIARTLGVVALVEGSVIREGTRIRVHAQLIRAATDEHFWSENYDRELQDVLALQSEVAQSIAAKVEVTLTADERARITSARSVSPDVYDSFLKGLFDGDYSRSGAEKRIAYLEDAIRKDPTFAPAYVALASAYGELGTPGIGVAPPAEVQPKVIYAVQKALELDPSLPQAHAIQASLYQAQWHWREAENEYKRTLDLNPNEAGTHLAYAGWLLSQGRTDEAQAWAWRARELDPFGIPSEAIGWILFQSHHYGEAIHEFKAALELHPQDASILWFLGFALIANRQPDQAIPVLEKAVDLSGRSPAIIAVLIRAYSHEGRKQDAVRLLTELKSRSQAGYVPAAAFVNAYLGLGDNEQALVWLGRGYNEHSQILQFLKVHPYFDPIREDPRFKDLLRRTGLAQ